MCGSKEFKTSNNGGQYIQSQFTDSFRNDSEFCDSSQQFTDSLEFVTVDEFPVWDSWGLGDQPREIGVETSLFYAT